jgi:hypothetical protein
MLTLLPNEHVSDGDLVRFLDGEGDPAEQERTDAHLRGCQPCTQRLQSLRRRSRGLSLLLAQTTPAAPEPDVLAAMRTGKRGQASPPWLRAAAAVLVVLSAALLAEPVRAWVADLLGIGQTELAAPTQPELWTTPLTPSAREAGTRVQFTPTGVEVELDIASYQAGGAIRFEAGEVPEVTVQVLGGTADLLVLPSGIRIGNTPESTADYQVTLPAGVRQVRVRVGGGAPRVIPAARVAAGERLDLARPMR